MKKYIFIFTSIIFLAQINSLHADCPNTKVSCKYNNTMNDVVGFLFEGQSVDSYDEHGYCHPLHYNSNALNNMCSSTFPECSDNSCYASWKE